MENISRKTDATAAAWPDRTDPASEQVNRLTNRPYSKRRHELHKKRVKLPVWEHKDAFLKLLDEHQSVVVVGETGSGKTTQIPQWCVDYCLKQNLDQKLGVACTQPRRIAAMSVAARVAEEMDVALGDEVGYLIRFENQLSNKTVLKYMTDGMLLREAMFDKHLQNYGVVILDEAHERTVQTEILFGVLKKAMQERAHPPLKVIIMSATINVKPFKKYFNSPILRIAGRQYPVQDMFTEFPQSDLLTSTLNCVFQVHRTSEEGDILVFCSGQDEIQSLVILTKKVLRQAPESLQNMKPFALYASLPAAQQMKVLDYKPKPSTNGYLSTNGHTGGGSGSTNGVTSHEHHSFTRKVIYATNVAETSITIPNIKYVIDTGKVKCRTFCPSTGFESLKVTTISKAQAKQRSGRAGRVAPGVCYRLYTNDHFESMVNHLPPEIKRCNLDSVVLLMISMGINNLNSFEFLERPEDSRINAALNNLLNLKAIKPMSSPATDAIATHGDHSKPTTTHDNLVGLSYELTPLGSTLRYFPLSPSMSRILVAAGDLNCCDEALTVVSLLSIENLFHIPPNKQSQADTVLQKFHSNEGDIVMLLKVYKAFKQVLLLNRAGLKAWCVEHFIHVKNLRTARLIRKQLAQLCRNMNIQPSSCGQDFTPLRRALTYGLFNNVATMWSGKYRNKYSDEIHIHPSSCLFRARPESVLYVEILETNKRYMRNCTLIDMSWIREVSASNLTNGASSNHRATTSSSSGSPKKAQT